ncbi:MAG: SpoIIE family protein phosphatase [bacterium]|nr:SpoIIE family protein phosphatase [bacterium]
MKVQSKFSLLLLVILLIFAVFMIVANSILDEQRTIFREYYSHQNTVSINSILDLRKNSLIATANDYTRWDDMFRFVNRQDRAWAKNNIDSLIKDFGASAVLIYNLKLDKIYSVFNPSKKIRKDFSVPMRKILPLLKKKSLVHYFSCSKDSLLEITAVKINPSLDVERTNSNGYFVMTRLWDPSYIKELEKITHHTVILHKKNKFKRDQKPAGKKNSNEIVISKMLRNLEGKEIACLDFVAENPEMEKLIKLSYRINVGIIVLMVIIVLIFIYAARRWMKRPFEILSRSLSREETEELGILKHTKDEFRNIAELIRNSLENKKRLEQVMKTAELDMEMAVNVQRNFLPREAPQTDEWDVAYYFKPMSQVSGDFYDFYMIDNNFAGLGLFDVSGHGIASALVAMIAKSILFNCFTKGYAGALNEVMEQANRNLQQEIRYVDNYLTGVLLRFSKNEVEYVNAGHPDIFLKTKDGASRVRNEKDVPISGFFLGVESLNIPYEAFSFTVEQGDYILLYTDCLPESKNTDKKLYGARRIRESFARAPAGTANEVLSFILGDLYTFLEGRRDFSDDLTVLVLKKL